MMGSQALVVVLSERTGSMVSTLARSGWTGPVLVVGSVAEAQQLLGSTAGTLPAAGTTPQPSAISDRPVLAPAPPPVPAHVGAATAPHDLGIVLDHDRQSVVTEDSDCGLTPLEFGMLEALAHEPGRTWRFEELTGRVWGGGDGHDWAPVHAVVRRLRAKLEQVRSPVEIVAVRGVGFRIEPAAVEHDADCAMGCTTCA